MSKRAIGCFDGDMHSITKPVAPFVCGHQSDHNKHFLSERHLTHLTSLSCTLVQEILISSKKDNKVL